MRLTADQLPTALTRGLAGTYLVSGDEPLLVTEAADAIRAAAKSAGHVDRLVFHVDRSFSWDDFRAETQSLSLFSDRRVLELRMPGGKPEKGGALLAELAVRPPADTVLLVVTEKLDKKAGDAAWVQAIAQHGAWVTVRSVATDALPEWLSARAKRAGFELAPAAAQLIAGRVEGNLLAAKQELENLKLLAAGGRISAELVLGSVADSARYDIAQLAEAASAGDAARALHILDGLRSEGFEPTLVLWALVRAVRGLWQARERRRLRRDGERGSAWNLVMAPSDRAVAGPGGRPRGGRRAAPPAPPHAGALGAGAGGRAPVGAPAG